MSISDQEQQALDSIEGDLAGAGPELAAGPSSKVSATRSGRPSPASAGTRRAGDPATRSRPARRARPRPPARPRRQPCARCSSEADRQALHASLPAITAAEPGCGMVLGIVVFREQVPVSAPMIALQIAGLLALVVGMVMVARAPALGSPPPRASHDRTPRRPVNDAAMTRHPDGKAGTNTSGPCPYRRQYQFTGPGAGPALTPVMPSTSRSCSPAWLSKAWPGAPLGVAQTIRRG